MSNPCKNCGANLPEGASFCPHCAQSQIERIEAKPPRLWRKKALMALAGAAAATAVVLAIVLPHRPKTYDGGGASVSYQDKDGAYELLLATAPGQIERKQPEEQRDLTLSPEDSSYITALLGVYQDGKLADAQTFLDKVERCTVEADPNEDGALELGPAEYNEMFDPAVLEANGINSNIYTGYAFGMGIERITNLKYQVKDLRMFSENDVRFLDEFQSAN